MKEVEIVPTQTISLNTGYLQIKAGITGARASALAALFGEYRIKKIIYTYRPIYDTYSSSLPGSGNYATQVPTLYWRLNRYGDTPATINGNYMRAMGAKPHRLDDKNITFSYAPNIILSQQNVAGPNTATIKVSPWLSTDDVVNNNAFSLSTAEHFGHSLFVEGAGAGTANGTVANMDVKVIYEFRNPRLNTVPPPPATLDASGNPIEYPSVVTLKV